jgi:hypothetical protein
MLPAPDDDTAKEEADDLQDVEPADSALASEDDVPAAEMP